MRRTQQALPYAAPLRNCQQLSFVIFRRKRISNVDSASACLVLKERGTGLEEPSAPYGIIWCGKREERGASTSATTDYGAAPRGSHEHGTMLQDALNVAAQRGMLSIGDKAVVVQRLGKSSVVKIVQL